MTRSMETDLIDRCISGLCEEDCYFRALSCLRKRDGAAQVSKSDEMFVKNEQLCIKNDELCIKNDELSILNDDFCSAVVLMSNHHDMSAT